MKTAIVMTAGLMSLGVVSITPAAAFHLTPQGNFTADGKTSATKSGVTLPCKAHFDGNIDANGVGHITGGSFKDVTGGQGCTLVSLSNLPWEIDATGSKTISLKGVQFNTPIGACGPGDISGKIAKGKLKLVAAPLPPDCTVSAAVKTKPTIKIVK